MTISKDIIAQAIAALSSVENIFMDSAMLAEDAMLLTFAFDEEEAYKAAVVNTVKVFKDISRDRVTVGNLFDQYEGWSSYHYRSRVSQGASANMRIIFKHVENSVYVLGFGHRHISSDIYRRLSELRNKRMR